MIVFVSSYDFYSFIAVQHKNTVEINKNCRCCSSSLYSHLEGSLFMSCMARRKRRALLKGETNCWPVLSGSPTCWHSFVTGHSDQTSSCGGPPNALAVLSTCPGPIRPQRNPPATTLTALYQERRPINRIINWTNISLKRLLQTTVTATSVF